MDTRVAALCDSGDATCHSRASSQLQRFEQVDQFIAQSYFSALVGAISDVRYSADGR